MDTDCVYPPAPHEIKVGTALVCRFSPDSAPIASWQLPPELRVGARGLNARQRHLPLGHGALGPVLGFTLVSLVPCSCWSSPQPRACTTATKTNARCYCQNDCFWRLLHVSWDLEETNQMTIESLQGKFSLMASSCIFSALKYPPSSPLSASCLYSQNPNTVTCL